MKRREFLAGLLAAPLAAPAATARPLTLTVSRSPACGCCGAWIDYMRRAGFAVEARELPDDALAALKARLGLRPDD